MNDENDKHQMNPTTLATRPSNGRLAKKLIKLENVNSENDNVTINIEYAPDSRADEPIDAPKNRIGIKCITINYNTR